MTDSHPNVIGKPGNRKQYHFSKYLVMVVLIASLFAGGCATQLTTRASKVRLLSAEQVQPIENKCFFLAFVRGYSSWYLIERIAYNNALNELLDNAGELGATHVFVDKGDVRNLLGEAYYCAFCLSPDGRPDRAYCQNPDGGIESNMSEYDCIGQGFQWIEAATDKSTCEAKGGKWIPNPKALREEKEQLDYDGGTSDGSSTDMP